MKERIEKLLTVKSIVTLASTVVFMILALKSVLSGEQFLMIFTTIIAFYFGTQSNKKDDKKE